MADDRQLVRLVFSDGGRVYARTQLLNAGTLDILREHFRNQALFQDPWRADLARGHDVPRGYKIDLGQGTEFLIHAEPAGDRP